MKTPRLVAIALLGFTGGCMRKGPAPPRPLDIEMASIDPAHAYSCGSVYFPAEALGVPVDAFVGSHKMIFDNLPLPDDVTARAPRGLPQDAIKVSVQENDVVVMPFHKPGALTEGQLI